MKKSKHYEVIERRPTYESKEEEQEALNRGALMWAQFERDYQQRMLAKGKEGTA